MVGAVAVAMLSLGSSAYAKGMLKDCKSELKKFNCEATTEAAAHECLEQHEDHGKKHDGFSKSCYKSHESYEKKMHKEEEKKS